MKSRIKNLAAPAASPALQTLPKRRGRQRSVQAQSAILSAALELLERKPLREVTSEAIALRAGVSKATIYKWWPNKSQVALDAYLSRMQNDVETPDTGSAQKDFTEQLKAVIRFYTSPFGSIYTQFIAEGQFDADFLVQFRDRFLLARRDDVRVMWRRGVRRGEICRKIDPEIALDLIYGPMIFRLLTGHAPLNDAQAQALVAAAFRGIRK